MDKYIKRDNLITFLDWDDGNGIWTLSDEELKHLEDKAIDAVPVVHARWYRHKGWRCSNCHKAAHDDEFCDPIFSDYCPNCGARMDGERHDSC